jgi:fructokinase
MDRAPSIVGLGEALWDVLPGGRQLGGAPLNVVCHVEQLLRSSGGCGVVASRVGVDALGREVVGELERREMAVEFLQRDPSHATSTVTVELADGGAQYTFASDIAWDHLEFTPQWEDLAGRCGAVCFGTLAQRSAKSRQTIWKFLDAAPRAIRLFDVNLRQGFYDQQSLVEGCRRATMVKLNNFELAVVAEAVGLVAELPSALDETTEPVPALRRLQEQFNLDAVVFTRGKRGTLLISGDKEFDPPPVVYPKTPRADCVGAGDACSAGILAGWVRGLPPAETAKLANQLGAFVASQHGATPTLPTEIVDLVG